MGRFVGNESGMEASQRGPQYDVEQSPALDTLLHTSSAHAESTLLHRPVETALESRGAALR